MAKKMSGSSGIMCPHLHGKKCWAVMVTIVGVLFILKDLGVTQLWGLTILPVVLVLLGVKMWCWASRHE